MARILIPAPRKVSNGSKRRGVVLVDVTIANYTDKWLQCYLSMHLFDKIGTPGLTGWGSILVRKSMFVPIQHIYKLLI